jgi:hypothetical protein
MPIEQQREALRTWNGIHSGIYMISNQMAIPVFDIVGIEQKRDLL